MPEGDTILHAALGLREALVANEVTGIDTPSPRRAGERWPERLGGRLVRAVDSRGKHLFIRFEGDLTLHSHLRMHGSWHVYRAGQPWRRAPHRAWLVLRTAEREVVQFDGPVLELLTDSRTRFDRHLAGLGPDVLADELDERKFLRRLREDDPTRALGEALLDQRNVAGIGNIWKSEGCFLAGVDPWRKAGEVSDDEALAVVRAVRPRMLHSAQTKGYGDVEIYGRAGRPCPRCASPIRARGQGDENRTTYWCPGCQQ